MSMIAAIAGAAEPIVASQPVQPEIAARPPIREPAAPAGNAPAPNAATPSLAEVRAAEMKPKSAAEAVKEAAKETAASPLDIYLRFRIDQKTQDITVFLLNQHTREVIRTIPPSELAKLKPGDLVNLFA